MEQQEKNSLSVRNAYPEIFGSSLIDMGFAVHIKAKRSANVIDQAIQMLDEMSAAYSEAYLSSFGSAVMLQIPHRLLASELQNSGISLPEEGKYAVAMLHLPQDAFRRRQIEQAIEERLNGSDKLAVIGWRDVPAAGEAAAAEIDRIRADQPVYRQLIVGSSPQQTQIHATELERAVFAARRQAENICAEHGLNKGAVASFSSTRILYQAPLAGSKLASFFSDLSNELLEAAFALVFTYRYSDERFSWTLPLACHYMLRSGKIHSLRSNRSMLQVRQHAFEGWWHEGTEDKLDLGYLDTNLPQSCGMYGTILADRLAEQYYLSSLPVEQCALQMMPNLALSASPLNKQLSAFYQYCSTQMEPWEGPAVLLFTDGERIGAMIDRNSFRSVRYLITNDELVLLSTRPASANIDEEQIAVKNRLRPGRQLLIDTRLGAVVADDQIKDRLSAQHPYQQWISEQLIHIDELPDALSKEELDAQELFSTHIRFGYTAEDVHRMVEQMAGTGQDPIVSMGFDAPIALLSNQHQRIYNYFKQQFQQVLSPAIDPVREEASTATQLTLGAERSLLHAEPQSCRHIKLDTPMLLNNQLGKLRRLRRAGLRAMTLPILFSINGGDAALVEALSKLGQSACRLVEKGHALLILSDRDTSKEQAAIPALLAVSAIHQTLIDNGLRAKTSLIVESAEPRETHHFALLLGYGADAVNPYTALDTIESLIESDALKGISVDKALRNYIQAATRGVVKVMSRIGIATVQAYRGSGKFETIGLQADWVNEYFKGTTCHIGGLSLAELAVETVQTHLKSYELNDEGSCELESGGQYQWRKDGEDHLFEPLTIHTLQNASRKNDFNLYKKFSSLVHGEGKRHVTLRSLFELNTEENASIPLEEVEPAASIVKRFKTGAMSYGAISKEAYESLAIAMNRLGAKSNSGEGGECAAAGHERSKDARSKVKQLASGRFGVTSSYLVHAEEIQIKIAQGAKPGEGGRLPGLKVYPWIAEARGTTPGVGLTSPPSHHDIYSTRDLAGLIYDLKQINPQARISVKLVSGSQIDAAAIQSVIYGAEGVLISGYEGGTAASPIGSLRHAGLPWEIGLIKAHQALKETGLRHKTVLETDGKLMTGRDVAIAALLGAEEYSFSTAPLVVLGCIMMRVCQLDTCPVGIAAQNPDLRKKYSGDPQHIVNYMTFIAEELREIMAGLGFRTVEEMIGCSDRLRLQQLSGKHKLAALQLEELIQRTDKIDCSADSELAASLLAIEDCGSSIDREELIPKAAAAFETGSKVEAEFKLYPHMRAVGTGLAGEVTRRSTDAALTEDMIHYRFNGRGGDSFGSFLPAGVTLTVDGDCNDFYGKGLSGGKLVIAPPGAAKYDAKQQIIVGNSALYGATSGEAYISGVAGARFAVRNSGAVIVAEGAGDHACEYMTGGCTVILGETGRNFGSGMTGGIAYMYDELGDFFYRCNLKSIVLERVEEDDDIDMLQSIVQKHFKYTGSQAAERILEGWDEAIDKFVKIIPKDYKRLLEHTARMERRGMAADVARYAAFEANRREVARMLNK
ncbi:glutamate synthase large subunit [Paenibacillus sp. IITD108]|uniref:glutamate synthase large subunit n=1 Tax=Paenibacillus sp. IITD108 TaxID=3116649 RepID=UPI002F3FCAF6